MVTIKTINETIFDGNVDSVVITNQINRSEADSMDSSSIQRVCFLFLISPEMIDGVLTELGNGLFQTFVWAGVVDVRLVNSTLSLHLLCG